MPDGFAWACLRRSNGFACPRKADGHATQNRANGVECHVPAQRFSLISSFSISLDSKRGRGSAADAESADSNLEICIICGSLPLRIPVFNTDRANLRIRQNANRALISVAREMSGLA